MSNEPTRITHLQAVNFAGLEELDVKLTKDTLVTGGTGAGKTSVLDLLRVAFTGKGYRAEVVRMGADKAVLLVELDDGTTVKRTMKGQRSASLAVTKDGMKPAKPQGYLDALFGPYAFNVADFFNKSVGEQTVELLALTAVTVSEEEYLSLAGGEVKYFAGMEHDRHPLEVLADLEEILFKERTDIRRDGKQKEGARAAAVEKLPDDFDAEAVRGINLTRLIDEQDAMHQHNERFLAIHSELQTIEERIPELEKELARFKDRQCNLTQWIAANPQQSTADVVGQIRTFQAQQTLLAAHDQAQSMGKEATDLAEEAARLTSQIEAIRAKPAELLAGLDELPIPGMGMDEEHNITINGKPLGTLSTGEQIDLAFDIAERYAGDVPVLLLDGLEALDSDMQAKLQEKLSGSRCQCVVTKVTDGALEIREW